MNKQWFSEWSSKRPQVLTAESYTPEEQLLEGIERWNTVLPEPKVSLTLTRRNQVGDVLAGRASGEYYYASYSHPNFQALEERVVSLETAGLAHPEWFSALAFPRGMAAIAAVLETIAGYHNPMLGDAAFIHHKVVYPSTRRLLESRETIWTRVGTKQPGLEVDLREENRTRQLLDPKYHIKVLGVICEPVANPTLDYTNIRAIAALAHEYRVPLIVDATLTHGILEPLRMGADIVVYSLSSYASGENDLLGGAVIGPNEFMADLQETRRHKGWSMSPRDAAEFASRMATLPQRMQLHCDTAAYFAHRLSAEGIGGITVRYPAIPDTRNNSAGGVVSFVFDGDEARNGDPPLAMQRAQRFSQYLCDNPGIVRQAIGFGEQQTTVFPFAGQIPDRPYHLKNHIPIGLVRIGAGRESDINRVAVGDYLVKAVKESL
ncbi:PLP-dependent transferase [Candidatus Woesearchaeota archaeon]|nr:PLP-dependent transferase [Candidatus Woesearchaeota archaeon]